MIFYKMLGYSNLDPSRPARKMANGNVLLFFRKGLAGLVTPQGTGIFLSTAEGGLTHAPEYAMTGTLEDYTRRLFGVAKQPAQK